MLLNNRFTALKAEFEKSKAKNKTTPGNIEEINKVRQQLDNAIKEKSTILAQSKEAIDKYTNLQKEKVALEEYVQILNTEKKHNTVEIEQLKKRIDMLWKMNTASYYEAEELSNECEELEIKNNKSSEQIRGHRKVLANMSYKLSHHACGELTIILGLFQIYDFEKPLAEDNAQILQDILMVAERLDNVVQAIIKEENDFSYNIEQLHKQEMAN
ncbi:MAG: hypothetical protein EBX41_02530 [Chitinophagia bacterium]|nr:hypothetical protein [Chitinophagia bacterium]